MDYRSRTGLLPLFYFQFLSIKFQFLCSKLNWQFVRKYRTVSYGMQYIYDAVLTDIPEAQNKLTISPVKKGV